MQRVKTVVFAVILSSLLAACGDGAEQPAAEDAFVSVDSWIDSRGEKIPVTTVIPTGKAAASVPLVVMAHGHGGSRQEGGGYQRVAEALAREGIATIRMDFPGCGDSTESFAENNLTNMLADLRAAREFALQKDEIDAAKVGLLGYSMGGRLVTLLAAEDKSVKAMAMWAPAVENGAARERAEFTRLSGDTQTYDRLKTTALEEGYAEYDTRWGATLRVGHRWFTDLEASMPLEAISTFEGPLLVLYGDADDVVPPAVAEAAIASATGSSAVVGHVVAGAQHGMGFYTNRPVIADEVVATTARFFSERL